MVTVEIRFVPAPTELSSVNVRMPGPSRFYPSPQKRSDIGNWQALHAARPSDADGNSVTGVAELVDCRNVLVESDGPRVSVIGLSDVIVVVDGGEVLVTGVAGTQKVGKLSGALNQ